MSSHKKMNPEVKKVWINELRSGRYRQTTAFLRNDGAFCCLGVLCDLSGATEWEGEHYDDATDLAPDVVLEWAGLSDATQRHLAGKNDDGATFAKIADWIEKHL